MAQDPYRKSHCWHRPPSVAQDPRQTKIVLSGRMFRGLPPLRDGDKGQTSLGQEDAFLRCQYATRDRHRVPPKKCRVPHTFRSKPRDCTPKPDSPAAKWGGRWEAIARRKAQTEVVPGRTGVTGACELEHPVSPQSCRLSPTPGSFWPGTWQLCGVLGQDAGAPCAGSSACDNSACVGNFLCHIPGIPSHSWTNGRGKPRPRREDAPWFLRVGRNGGSCHKAQTQGSPWVSWV